MYGFRPHAGGRKQTIILIEIIELFRPHAGGRKNFSGGFWVLREFRPHAGGRNIPRICGDEPLDQLMQA